MIELKNIYKKYEQKTVLNNISTSFKKHKITSLIGANGAGKSTALGIASRLIKADSGSVIIDGLDINKYKNNELAQKISILKQQNNINIRLRVKELVGFGRFPYSQGKLNSKDEEKIKEAIAYMDLEDLQDRFLDSLSGGQRQRAYIAMVIAQDTDYIFLDEPLNNLDMKHSLQIMKILKSLANDFNKSIILVLHDINFASVHSDEIVAMRNGEILYHKESKELIKEEILKDVFDMDISIHDIKGKKICFYFD
ncbi:ATP-binding cassette domain-containing protein [uncultured Campylobacter sp.]|uniref:iron ABC transporter ATP-binding protein n=1 Tax=uncultured Campylobacter sp. TaxID=218934 RepID=UPI002636C107|nr:ATP-binding cassette domain-containing protein [uncultured Campylobacter sp.]